LISSDRMRKYLCLMLLPGMVYAQESLWYDDGDPLDTQVQTDDL